MRVEYENVKNICGAICVCWRRMLALKSAFAQTCATKRNNKIFRVTLTFGFPFISSLFVDSTVVSTQYTTYYENRIAQRIRRLL